jgi:RNA polymerase sigma-70 factor (ECF subfamily)
MDGCASSGEYPMPFRLTGPAILPIWRTPPAIASGDGADRLEEEVVALFDQFRDPLLRYLSSFGLAPADGEELIQEVFLSLFQHLHRGKSRENLRGWLFRVAHNLALKRRYRTRRELEARSAADGGDLAIDPSPSPEAQVVNSQTQQRLLAVVEALPEQCRRCLFLRAEGLRYREIAGILDMSLGAVSLSLARSLARIARAAER